MSENAAQSVTEDLSDSDVLTEGPSYNKPPKKTRVKWYRCKVPGDQLRQLNKRSDLLGGLQTFGFLGLLFGCAAAAIYSSMHWPWYVTPLLVFVNGHFWQFTINGFHELVHDSVFRTRWMNWIALRVFAFIGWHNHHGFWASHTEHHKYTLHPPDDLEVVQPQKLSRKDLLKYGIVNVRVPYDTIKGTWKMATMPFEKKGKWMQSLFPASDPQRRRVYKRWAWILLGGHVAIVAIAMFMGWWLLPLVVTFPRIFGNWLQNLCNTAQHIGLQENNDDFRVCCRTIYLNPILQFLYWHMNYHTEHHMFAAVPCYKLGKLHRLIKDDMPQCPNGLVETWKHIADVQQKQNADPSYRFIPELPSRSN